MQWLLGFWTTLQLHTVCGRMVFQKPDAHGKQLPRPSSLVSWNIGCHPLLIPISKRCPKFQTCFLPPAPFKSKMDSNSRYSFFEIFDFFSSFATPKWDAKSGPLNGTILSQHMYFHKKTSNVDPVLGSIFWTPFWGPGMTPKKTFFCRKKTNAQSHLCIKNRKASRRSIKCLEWNSMTFQALDTHVLEDVRGLCNDCLAFEQPCNCILERPLATVEVFDTLFWPHFGVNKDVCLLNNGTLTSMTLNKSEFKDSLQRCPQALI